MWKLFEDKNNINEKNIIGFASFIVMVLFAVADLLTSLLANKDLWNFVLDGKIRHHIDQIFPLKDAKAALEIMNNNKHFGKLVLLVN